MRSEIKIWEYNWQRMKNITKILQKVKENEAHEQNEIEIIGDAQSPIKPENWREISTQIMTQNPPISNSELCKMGYGRFKEHRKISMRYQTYYLENINRNKTYPHFQHVKYNEMVNHN